MAVTASEARKRLFSVIEQVNEDRKPVEITSLHGGAVLLSKADYDEAGGDRIPAPGARQRAATARKPRRERPSGKRDEHDSPTASTHSAYA